MKKLLLSICAMATLALSAQNLKGKYAPLDSVQGQFRGTLSNSNQQSNDTSIFINKKILVRGIAAVGSKNSLLNAGRNIWIQQTNASGKTFGLQVWHPTPSGATGTNWAANKNCDQGITNEAATLTGIYNIQEGDSVEIQGTIGEFRGETQLVVANGTDSIISLGSDFDVVTKSINISELNNKLRVNQHETGEVLEGTLVEIKDVKVISLDGVSPNTAVHNQFTVEDADGFRVQIRDEFKDFDSPTGRTCKGKFNTPVVGTTFSSIKGIVKHFKNSGTFGYTINPRSEKDVIIGTAPPTITNIQRNIVVPKSTESVNITATITDAEGVNLSKTKLFYAVGINATVFTEVAMTVNSTTYTGTIPAQSDDAYVQYYIESSDINDFKSTSSTFAYLVKNAGLGVKDLQFTPNSNGNSLFTGSTVTVTGVVTATSALSNLGSVYIQQENELAWAGIWLIGSGINTFTIGQKVTVTGTVEENFNMTRINVSSASNAGVGTITPLKLDPAIFTTPSFATCEQYEGMLVKLVNPTTNGKLFVVNGNPDGASNFGDFRVGSNAQSPNSGTRVLVGRVTSSTFSTLNASFVNDSKWATLDGTIQATALPVQVVTSSAPPTSMDSLVGILYFGFGEYRLLPRNNADFYNVTNTITSIDGVVLSNNETNLFPNPTEDILTISTSSETFKVSIFDLAGKLVLTQTKETSVDSSVSLAELPSGTYFVNVVSKNENLVKRIVKQ